MRAGSSEKLRSFRKPQKSFRILRKGGTPARRLESAATTSVYHKFRHWIKKLRQTAVKVKNLRFYISLRAIVVQLNRAAYLRLRHLRLASAAYHSQDCRGSGEPSRLNCTGAAQLDND